MNENPNPVRKRRLLRRLWKLALGAAACILAPILTVYLYYGVRVWFGEVRVTRDYLKEFNAAAAATPMEERGWPLVYKSLLTLSQPPLVRTLRGDASVPIDQYLYEPDSPHWPDVIKYLAENQAALDLVRLATERRRLAFQIGIDHPPYRKSEYSDDEHDESQSTDTNSISTTTLYTALRAPLQALRQIDALLYADSISACQFGESKNVVANIRARLRIAEWSLEYPLVICQIVSSASIGATCRLVAEVLEHYPEVLSDSDWLEVEQALAAFNGGSPPLATAEADFAEIEYLMQRIYTDNGAGSGVFSLSAYERLEKEAKSRLEIPCYGNRVMNTLAAPVMAAFFHDRKATQARLDRFRSAHLAGLQGPLWEQPEVTPFDIEHDLMDQHLINWRRFVVIGSFLPPLSRTPQYAGNAAQRRDAARVSIALELHRRRHGAYPESLEDLVPGMLPAVPPDYHNGRPLNYSLCDGVPVLYSVGTDLDDDGGAPPVKMNSNRDARESVTRWYHPAKLERRPWRERVPDGDWILFPPSYAIERPEVERPEE